MIDPIDNIEGIESGLVRSTSPVNLPAYTPTFAFERDFEGIAYTNLVGTTGSVRTTDPATGETVVIKPALGEMSNMKLLRTFTADEDITANDAVVAGPAYLASQTTNDTSDTLTASRTDLGQSVQEPENTVVWQVLWRVSKTGSPSGGLQVALQGDSAGEPDGSDIAVTATIAAADLSTSATVETFEFSSGQTLTGATTYWLVLRFTGTTSGSDFYTAWRNSAGGYGNGLLKENTGGWSASIGDAHFLLVSARTGHIVKTNAAQTGLYNGFVGFAVEDIPTGKMGRVCTAGVMGGWSGLDSDLYYLSDTAGAISSSMGSNTRKVGVAVSSTQILLTNIW